MHATGDMVAEPNGKDDDNVYVTRLELSGGKISRVLEYINPIVTEWPKARTRHRRV